MTFLDTLLSLDKAATPGPMFLYRATTEHFAHLARDIAEGGDGGTFRSDADAERAQLLINAAPRLAALIESVAAYKAAVDAHEAYDRDDEEYVPALVTATNAYRAMLASLAALDKGAE